MNINKLDQVDVPALAYAIRNLETSERSVVTPLEALRVAFYKGIVNAQIVL